MTTQKVLIAVETNNLRRLCDVIVKAEVEGRSISTGNPMAGQGNIYLYDVQFRGQVLSGEWDGDGRHPIEVSLPTAHPLARWVGRKSGYLRRTES